MDKSLFLLGGATWINLLNTLYLSNKQKTDLLEQPSAVLQWLDANDLLRESDLSYLQNHDALLALIRQLHSLRQLCKDVYTDIELHKSLTENTEAAIKRIADHLSIQIILGRKDANLSIVYEGTTTNDHVIYQIVVSIIHTLQHVSFDRLRKCEHEDCILYFADTSKSGKRRWCSMETCGNRQKAAEYYAKKKQQKQ